MKTKELRGPEPYRIRGYRVRVVRGDATVREFSPGNIAQVKIGSAEGNSLVLPDPTVSRFHLRLHASAEGVHVEDLGTTNGSFVGGARFREIEVQRTTEIEVGQSTLRVELEADREIESSGRESFGGLTGRSGAMQHVMRELAFAARSKELSVLLRGETGTGKEVAARAVHEAGPRAKGPFVVVDCAGLSPTLIEGQLFGHVKGAFTDAKASTPGPFELADGGTVFLDEIGELPLPQQAKLLRVLQEREVTRVGATKPVKVNVKVLSATRRDLLEEVNAGRFREDLYYRIAGEEIVLPPLRDRLDDLPLLARAIVDEILAREGELATRGIPDEVVNGLRQRSFPGNVRELHHTIHRYLVRGELAPPRSLGQLASNAARLEDLLEMRHADALRELEFRLARHALEREAGNYTRAAKRLGIDRSTLYRLLQRSAPDRDQAARGARSGA
ncbi:sigma 54-interacting transcriptional regulator [Sorangium atrum]|uniref:Sigma 54-interacting transcriptional regulator n=1 Tax=Sorangium atrum TaxID=2995308 RepID=A0ABT5C530_9BACT|nr:sigma 54-interacting transcriptional regulator [Sorangium aterium]MDC0681525.1 sigma 54-interacting transcriptional regulator [Sorangium aterium]